MTHEIDWSTYESGPFCTHWGEVGSCERECSRCGHTCNAHWNALDEECHEHGCECPGFLE